MSIQRSTSAEGVYPSGVLTTNPHGLRARQASPRESLAVEPSIEMASSRDWPRFKTSRIVLKDSTIPALPTGILGEDWAWDE